MVTVGRGYHDNLVTMVTLYVRDSSSRVALQRHEVSRAASQEAKVTVHLVLLAPEGVPGCPTFSLARYPAMWTIHYYHIAVRLVAHPEAVVRRVLAAAADFCVHF